MKRVAALVLTTIIMSSTVVHADTTVQPKSQINVIQSIDYTLSFMDTISMPIEYNKKPYELKITRLTSQIIDKNSSIEFKIEGNNDIINAITQNNLVAKINNKLVSATMEKSDGLIKVIYKPKDLTDTKLHWEFTFIDGDKYYSTGSYFLVATMSDPIVKINTLSDTYPFETRAVSIEGLIGSSDFDINSQCVFLKVAKNSLIDTAQIKNLIEEDNFYYIYLNDTAFGKSVPINYSIPIKKLLTNNAEPIEGCIVAYTNDFLGYKGKKYELSPFKFTIERPNFRLGLLERIKQFGSGTKNFTISIYDKVTSLFGDNSSEDIPQKSSPSTNTTTVGNVFDKTLEQMADKNTQTDTVINITVSNKVVANSYANIDNFVSIFSNEYRKNIISGIKTERINALETYISNGKVEINLDSKVSSTQANNTSPVDTITTPATDFERYLTYPLELLKKSTDADSKKLLNGMELVQQGSELEKAKEFFKDLINKKFNEVLCYRYMAEINLIEKEYNKAIENVRAGLKVYKSGDEAYISKGELYLTIAYAYNLTGNYTRSNSNLDVAKAYKIGTFNGFPLAYENNKKHLSK